MKSNELITANYKVTQEILQIEEINNKKKIPVVLDNYRKEGLDIIKDKESAVPGYIVSVNDNELGRLDYYEGTGSLYKIIDVEIEGFTNVKAYQLI